MAGLSATGIDIETLESLLASMEADQLTNIDAELNIEADSILGQINGIYAAKLLELWELVEEVYHAAYPDTATGQALSYVSTLSGTVRNPATFATVPVECTFTSTPTLPIGTAVYVDGDPDSRFELLAAHALTSSPEVVVFTASTAGTETVALAVDTAVIETPVTNWTAAAFDQDYTAGLDVETDSALRTRREENLALPGTSTIDAIRADILANVDTNATTCTVFENSSGTTDGNGVPPHAIECVVGDDGVTLLDSAELAQQIWDSHPAGTQTYGSSNATATDTALNTHTMYWSEPTVVPIHVAVTLTQDASIYVGDTAVKAAIAAIEADFVLGQDIFSSDVVTVVSALTGVTSVDTVLTYVKNSDPPTSSYTYATGVRELISLDTANVDVTS